MWVYRYINIIFHHACIFTYMYLSHCSHLKTHSDISDIRYRKPNVYVYGWSYLTRAHKPDAQSGWNCHAHGASEIPWSEICLHTSALKLSIRASVNMLYALQKHDCPGCPISIQKLLLYCTNSLLLFTILLRLIVPALLDGCINTRRNTDRYISIFTVVANIVYI